MARIYSQISPLFQEDSSCILYVSWFHEIFLLSYLEQKRRHRLRFLAFCWLKFHKFVSLCYPHFSALFTKKILNLSFIVIGNLVIFLWSENFALLVTKWPSILQIIWGKMDFERCHLCSPSSFTFHKSLLLIFRGKILFQLWKY